MEKDLTQNESLIKRVVICGPESTGKSTLAVKLASYFKTNYVSEYARDYLQSKWDDKKELCNKEDLIKINERKQYVLASLNFKKTLPYQTEAFRFKAKFIRKILNLLVIS